MMAKLKMAAVCMVVASMLTVCAAGIAADRPADAATTQPRDLATIRRERLELLENRVRRAERAVSDGRSSLAELMDKQQDVLCARIEMAEDLKEELASRQQLVQLLLKRENQLNAAMEQGRGDFERLDKARNERLREEYLLAKRRAEAKILAAPSAKGE